jgi:hypothetical protein
MQKLVRSPETILQTALPNRQALKLSMEYRNSTQFL